MPNEIENAGDETVDERDDVSAAPESGQLVGGREDPWQGEAREAGGPPWPQPHHASPKDEL